ncbi:MAG: hypothetical protein ABI242_09420 [Caulobacteraceae bacterium]
MAVMVVSRRAPRGRPLTPGEWNALSPGLALALAGAGAQPRLIARAHPAARVAAIWRGGVPILTRGEAIWWPGALADVSTPGRERAMAVLQHELQHVLDYVAGRLTAVRYLRAPRHWTYSWRPGDPRGWDALGFEQRGALAERLWLAERGVAGAEDLPALRSAIPWALEPAPANRRLDWSKQEGVTLVGDAG